MICLLYATMRVTKIHPKITLLNCMFVFFADNCALENTGKTSFSYSPAP